MVKVMVDNFSKNPYKLFLIDGMGACLSLSLYLFVIIPWIVHIGMPVDKVYILTVLAAFYAIFSLTCYFLRVRQWQYFMKGISVANLLHSLISLLLVTVFWNQLTILGLFYFFGEILLVTTLAGIEWRTALKK